MTGLWSVWFLASLAVAISACRAPSRGTNEEPHTAPDRGTELASIPTNNEPAALAEVPAQPAPLPGNAATAVRMWTFDDGSPGQPAIGFATAIGQWQVTNDETAPSGSHVLAQLATSADDVFNVAFVTGTSYRDVDISVQLRSVSGRVDQGGGLVWRAHDARSYYVARYNPLEDNFRLYKVVNGRRRMLESATLRIDHKGWHTLRIVMQGDHIECYLDGTRHLDVRDATFSDGGQIGLWTKADAQTHFDDLAVGSISSSGGEP